MLIHQPLNKKISPPKKLFKVLEGEFEGELFSKSSPSKISEWAPHAERRAVLNYRELN